MSNRPNILFITSDQQRGDCYGFAGRNVKTPHLDHLAAGGYQKVVVINPNYADAHYNLGLIFQKLERVGEAVDSLQKAIALKPDYAGGQHIINGLLGKTTDSAPRNYVEGIFDSYANRFEDHLIQDLKYEMPSMLKEAVIEQGLADGTFKNAVDLGCGTGFAGLAFRDVVDSLTGIDLSDNMVRQAEKKKIYDELVVDDLIGGLESLKTTFDLFISADVFIYVGKLLPLFQCVQKHSGKDSLFVFSTEHTDGDDFVLCRSSRYAHPKNYILSVAGETGFRLEHFSKSNLRFEGNQWIEGGIYILRRL